MWGARPPTFLDGFKAPRGRPDPKNRPQKIPARLPSGTQPLGIQHYPTRPAKGRWVCVCEAQDHTWLHFGIHGPKPYEFIGFGAVEVTKPYEFIGFGAMDVTKPYEFMGFGEFLICQGSGIGHFGGPGGPGGPSKRYTIHSKSRS